MDVTQTKRASVIFYECAELVDHIAQMSSWSTLVALTHTDQWLRSIVFRLIRSRTVYFIGHFVVQDQLIRFFNLLESTDAAVAGSLIRCIMSISEFGSYREVHPIQINIVIPYKQTTNLFDSSARSIQRWRRFFIALGYHDYNALSRGTGSPFHTSASATVWSLFCNVNHGKRVSLIQSKTSSAISPVLQSLHTSSFFAMSATRFYCLYPKLFARNININMRFQVPYSDSVFDSFNYGMVTTNPSDYFESVGDSCGEACASEWRRTFGLKGVGVSRWGGFLGNRDVCNSISRGDIYGNRREIWKIDGECANDECPNIVVCTRLLDVTF